MDNLFKEAEMKQLKDQMEDTLKNVRSELKKVELICQSDPSEDDTVLNAICEAGNKMTDTWDVLEKSFNELISGLSSIIQSWITAITQRKNSIEEYKNQVSNG